MIEKKKYLLFSGEDYYPRGGFKDLSFMSDDFYSCIGYFTDHHKNMDPHGESHDWAQIVNYETLEILLYGQVERDVIRWEKNEDDLF